jgi:hypothetical protein
VGEGRIMKDKWLVTLEIDTYDGPDPRYWDWSKLLTGDYVKVIESQFKGRVLPTSEGESNG